MPATLRESRRAAWSAIPDPLTLLAFVTVVLIVAANVVAVRFTNREVPPFWGAGTRFALASAILFAWVVARRLPLPRGRALAGTLFYGLLQFALAIAMVYVSLLRVPAGLASVIYATMPLFTIAFAALARLETLRLRGVAGALLALVGIALAFGERAGRDVPPAYFLAAVAAAASFALGPVVAKRFPSVHLIVMNAVGMLAGALVLLGVSLALGEPVVLPQQPATWAAYAFLVLAGSAWLFPLILFTVRRWTATAVSHHTVLSPPVSIGLSAWLLGEPVTGGLLLGSLLVIAGVYIGVLAPARRS
jgi:drug/metabolite transporter (DMT)-like permease